MSTADRDIALKGLFDAFAEIDKPKPLTTYERSYCHAEVDAFNEIDWEEVTYSDYVEGQEGAIICPAQTKAYLLPRLFKMVMLRRHGQTDGAVDNLSIELETWPVDSSVEALLNKDQRKAIIAAWSYLDRHLYHPSGSHVARVLAQHWQLEE